VGHNEAGGWMVLGLLGLLVVQTVTGLCANDDGETEGPLVKFVGKALSDQLSKVHDINFKLVMIAVSLHVLAVIMYAVVKRHDLVRPMLTGAKRLPAATPAPRIVNSLLALVILLVAVGIMLVVRAL
jgi:cytochrome b